MNSYFSTSQNLRVVYLRYFDSEASTGGLANSVYEQTYQSAVNDAVAAGF